MESDYEEASAVVVQDNPANRTWEALLDGKLVGVVVYERAGESRLALTHAAIEEHHRMHGIGTRLISTMLDAFRARGETITVWCTAVIDFLEKHPEYRDLVDASDPGRAPVADWGRTTG
jgi:predicted GNAT family acetyltransferase